MELFKLLGTIAINNSEANKALKETSSAAKDTADDIGDAASEGEKSSSRLGSALKKVGSGALAVGKTVATGLAVGASALAGLTAKALSAAGELEQNMGGSEAVFGEHAGKMQDTAKNAFSNMGLSASEFLGTANKMGALFQGAGFGIEESATMSADAMQRAADVASIMGIDTASAMEAIAGAAKGNFTMMDNLGVAMNDTTLNAYALEKGINKTTQEMTNQEKISLAMEMFMEKTAYAAGNYAKENETLAGSLGTAKAALSNFLSGAGTVEDVVSSFTNAGNVIVKNINTMFPSLMNGITQLVNQLVPLVPPLLEQLLPGLIEGATGLINGVVSAMPQIISALLAAVPALIQGITQIINALISALPSIMQALVSALPTLIPPLINGLVSMIVMLCEMLPQIIQPIINYLPAIIISIVNALLQNLPALIQGLITLVLGIVAALPQIIQALIDALPQLIAMIVRALLENLPALIIGFVQLFAGVVEAIMQIDGALKKAFADVFKGIWEAIKKVFAPLGGWFKNKFAEGSKNAQQAWASVKNFFSNIWSGIKNTFSSIGSWFKQKFTEGKNNAQQAWSTVKNFFANIWSGIKNVFSSIGSWFGNLFTSAKNRVQNAWSGVKNFFSNIKNGIVNAFSNIKEKLTAPFTKARDTIKGIADKIKGFFKGEISMPKIKLPHFKINPSGWKVGDLLDGSIPKLSIDWYARAMNQPIIMTKPTVFGYNGATGELMGGGEAGSEVVSGTNTLMSMIQNAVANQMNGLAYYIQKVVEILADYFPQLLEAMDRDVVLDSGEVVGALAVPMNQALGRLSARKERGR